MSVRYAILGLLHHRNMHGYKIKELIESNFGHMWTINYGQIYPTLKQMRTEGLVTLAPETRSDGPDRKVYSITKEGREEFNHWLNEAPEKNVVLRDPFLLRFAFFDFGDRERALEMIEGQISDYEAQMKKRLDNMPLRAKGSDYGRLLSELGVNLNQMMLDWLKKARTELRQEKKPAQVRKPRKTTAACAESKSRKRNGI